MREKKKEEEEEEEGDQPDDGRTDGRSQKLLQSFLRRADALLKKVPSPLLRPSADQLLSVTLPFPSLRSICTVIRLQC